MFPGRVSRVCARLIWVGLGAVWLTIAAPSTTRASTPAPSPFRILVFSKTTGFRHASIPAAIGAIQQLGVSNQFSVTATEDSAAFEDTNLRQFACVVFCLTTGDVLNGAQKAAFTRYIHSGGGFVGLHSASDTEHSWPWYGQLVGAFFESHPPIQTGTVKVSDSLHPSTAGLPKRWVRTDEWYSFAENPRGRVHVLATLDERTYAPADAMGADHPIAWCHSFEGGRVWYTAGGHTLSSYAEPEFLQHLLGGILWAANAVPGDAGATVDEYFQKVILLPGPHDPMQLAVAADGRVFFAQRSGRLRIWKPDTSETVLGGILLVDDQREDGLLGIALDPGFASNQWLYLFYSPLGTNAVQRVSRFNLIGDHLDFSSEKILLTIPVQRETCCHSAGGLNFGLHGELFIGVGDNTNPFESAGFNPIDERPGRASWDAQKSASNANDLRGKILRIIPQLDGAYAIPEGNLFPPGTPNTRPEIYIMGNRNPFRFSIDSATGWLYWGEVGPDAASDDPNRGPRGYDEWNQARSAGNFGWPYFIADNRAYHDFDFSTQASGPAFDPTLPLNQSPNNTGPVALPPAQPAWIWYAYNESAEFPAVNGAGGRTAMAGPVYHFDSSAPANGRRLPAYYDQSVFLFEWSRNFVKEVKLDDNGNVLSINPFLSSFGFSRPMDMKIGPDGAIYLLEWGSGFGGANADAKVTRIEYIGRAQPSGIALQWSSTLEGPFISGAGATLNPIDRTFTLPLPKMTRFYRVAGPNEMRVTSIRATLDSLILSYEPR